MNGGIQIATLIVISITVGVFLLGLDALVGGILWRYIDGKVLGFRQRLGNLKLPLLFLVCCI